MKLQFKRFWFQEIQTALFWLVYLCKFRLAYDDKKNTLSATKFFKYFMKCLFSDICSFEFQVTVYSLIFHFIKVSCTGTTSLLKCKIHTIHFQITFPLLFWTIKNINPSHTTRICLYTCTTQGLTPRKTMSVHNLMKTFTLVRFSITLHFLVHGKDLRFSSLWSNNLTF